MADSATLPQTYRPHVALITGAAQGIGRAIALRLAEDGLDIAIADLKSQRTNLVGVAEDVRAKGRRCIVLECDISQEEEVQHMVQATEKEFNGLDVMVANAGRILVKPMVDSKPVPSLIHFDGGRIISSAEEYAKHVGLPDGKTFIQGYQTHAALPRIGTPEDIAGMVSFLAGKDSAYITGQTITIDGGVWMD